MTIEQEAKLKVSSHESVREQLVAQGATWLGCWREFNAIYDTTSQSLIERGSTLRLRRYSPEAALANPAENHPLTPPRAAVITLKGPSRPSRFKAREELEIDVSDADNADLMLQRLGYTVLISFEKRRESWRWQDCIVELDEVPLLGLYVEIEGPGDDRIAACQAELGLADVDHVSRGYLSMLQDQCARDNRSPLNLRLA